MTRSSPCSVHPSGSKTREKRMEKTALLRPSRCGVVLIHPCQQASFSSSSRYSDPLLTNLVHRVTCFFGEYSFSFEHRQRYSEFLRKLSPSRCLALSRAVSGVVNQPRNEQSSAKVLK